MATVSINIPDALVPRLVAAARAMYPQHAALTDVALFKKVTAAHWQSLLANYEADAAYTAAAAKGAADSGGIGE